MRMVNKIGEKKMSDIQVKIYEEIPDENIKFVVICCKYQDKWVWAKHRQRNTYEIPGGHREEGEEVETAARRELEEETGAVRYRIKKIGNYGVYGKTIANESGKETFGSLFYAEIEECNDIHSEIESIALFDELPSKLTYPDIQPLLLNYVKKCLPTSEMIEKT